MWETLPSYLATAEATAAWIRSTAQETEHGLVWLPDPDHPERRSTITPPATCQWRRPSAPIGGT